MNTITSAEIRAATEVEDRPAVQHDAPLPPVTEDPRYIGTSAERPSARRLVQGQGQYIDDLNLPRMVHVVYWRSPLAHARIGRIATEAAAKAPGPR